MQDIKFVALTAVFAFPWFGSVTFSSSLNKLLIISSICDSKESNLKPLDYESDTLSSKLCTYPSKFSPDHMARILASASHPCNMLSILVKPSSVLGLLDYGSCLIKLVGCPLAVSNVVFVAKLSCAMAALPLTYRSQLLCL